MDEQAMKMEDQQLPEAEEDREERVCEDEGASEVLSGGERLSVDCDRRLSSKDVFSAANNCDEVPVDSPVSVVCKEAAQSTEYDELLHLEHDCVSVAEHGATK